MRRGVGVRLSRLLVPACLIALLVSPGAAHEPEGRTFLRYSWASGKQGRGGARLLRVSVTAAVPLHDVRLRLDAPPALLVTLRGSAGREKPLGDLPKGGSMTLEFDVVVPASGGAIAGFRIEGTTDDGHFFSEGLGVPVGTPGAVPVVRSGAAEFPASTAEAPRK